MPRLVICIVVIGLLWGVAISAEIPVQAIQSVLETLSRLTSTDVVTMQNLHSVVLSMQLERQTALRGCTRGYAASRVSPAAPAVTPDLERLMGLVRNVSTHDATTGQNLHGVIIAMQLGQQASLRTCLEAFDQGVLQEMLQQQQEALRALGEVTR